MIYREFYDGIVLNYLAFKLFGYECTWRLLKKLAVGTKLDIFVFFI
jgi:hypothetical protein